ncbi:unnamed protein product [Vitrella brassicaformis CCMP3155]|uniref:subtilisin n=3 Tax=Vitrella brassicaformis TaxID=1169539 RepID=A0A0G4GZX8_VITBC|nr:unnamed protein product [Vitrella brassicaformis CCMP3155]|eukprot:CEM36777.1 unnamed protein product [Vitrella brassicaformis CCMP3155]
MASPADGGSVAVPRKEREGEPGKPPTAFWGPSRRAVCGLCWSGDSDLRGAHRWLSTTDADCQKLRDTRMTDISDSADTGGFAFKMAEADCQRLREMDKNVILDSALRAFYHEWCAYRRVLQASETVAPSGSETEEDREFALRVDKAGYCVVDCFLHEPYPEDSCGSIRLKDAVCRGRVCSGWLSMSDIPSIESLSAGAGIHRVELSRSFTRAGKTITQGSGSINVTRSTREKYGVDGSGVKVGVIADSFDQKGLPPTGADDRSSGDLPQVQVVSDYSLGRDEGRAVLQIVHDIAPGAQLYYATGFGGLAKFSAAIDQLVDVGCDIIVDDVVHVHESFFHEVVKSAFEHGVAYVSATGNEGLNSYEAPFRSSAVQGPGLGILHDFDYSPGNVDVYQTISIAPDGRLYLVFQWTAPQFSTYGPPGPLHDFDIYLALPSYATTKNMSDILAKSTWDNRGADPVEVLYWTNSNYLNKTFLLMIELVNGPLVADPVILKWIDLGNNGVDKTALTYDTQSPTAFGHVNIPEAFSVGASNYQYFTTDWVSNGTHTPNRASSGGPIPSHFDNEGRRMDPPALVYTPDVVAPDGVDTTFFGGWGDTDATGYPNFFGTSAAAPHVGALMALMKQQDPSLAPRDLYLAVRLTAVSPRKATPMDDKYSFRAGWGVVDGRGALALTDWRKKMSKNTAVMSCASAGGILEQTATNNGLAACCPARCGVCSEIDCESRSHWTHRECCPSVIPTGRMCDEVGRSPCMIDKSRTTFGTCLWAGGIVSTGADRGSAVCCPMECGVCQQGGCEDRPGGVRNCCPKFIFAERETRQCFASGQAPCLDDPPSDQALTCMQSMGGLPSAGGALCCPKRCGKCSVGLCEDPDCCPTPVAGPKQCMTTDRAGKLPCVASGFVGGDRLACPANGMCSLSFSAVAPRPMFQLLIHPTPNARCGSDAPTEPLVDHVIPCRPGRRLVDGVPMAACNVTIDPQAHGVGSGAVTVCGFVPPVDGAEGIGDYRYHWRSYQAAVGSFRLVRERGRCAAVVCPPPRVCVNAGLDGTRCDCPPGYQDNGDGLCRDIDECARGWDGCSYVVGATCENTVGSYTCKCPEFYAFNTTTRRCDPLEGSPCYANPCRDGRCVALGDTLFSCRCYPPYTFDETTQTCVPTINTPAVSRAPQPDRDESSANAGWLISAAVIAAGLILGALIACSCLGWRRRKRLAETPVLKVTDLQQAQGTHCQPAAGEVLKSPTAGAGPSPRLRTPVSASRGGMDLHSPTQLMEKGLSCGHTREI